VLADHRKRSFHRYVVGGHCDPQGSRAPVPTGALFAGVAGIRGVRTRQRSTARGADRCARPNAPDRRAFNDWHARHDDDSTAASVYDNYYGDPTLPNPNLYPLTTPPYWPPDISRSRQSGGLRTDEHARVLRADDTVIDRLYAVGNTRRRSWAAAMPGPATFARHDVRLHRGRAHRRPSEKP